MKTVYLLILLLIANLGWSQDWELFPCGQKSYYKSHDGSTLHEVFCDSIYYSGDTLFQLFYSKPSYPELSPCVTFLDSVNNNNYEGFFSFTVQRVGNWMMFRIPWYDNDIFKLNFDTLPGSSWNIEIDYVYADISEYTIVYDSVTVNNILGIADSVRYYSIHTGDPQDSEFALDKVVLQLSKSFGLIQMPKLEQLLSGKNGYYDQYAPYHFSGYINEEDTIGLVTPTNWSDFFQLKAGDILKFKKTSGYTVTYFRKLITEVVKTDANVEVHYLNDGGYLLSDRFYRDALQYVLPYRGNSYMYGPANYSDPLLTMDYDDTAVSKLESWLIDTIYVPGKVSLRKSYSNENWQYGDNCEFGMAMGFGTTTTFNSYLGLVGWSYGDYDYNYDVVLVGTVIDGITTGNYWPVTIEEQFGNNLNIAVHPNPAVDIIYVDGTGMKDYVIFNLNGQPVKKGIVSNGEISIDTLPKGFYVIELRTETEISRGKFIKSNG